MFSYQQIIASDCMQVSLVHSPWKSVECSTNTMGRTTLLCSHTSCKRHPGCYPGETTSHFLAPYDCLSPEATRVCTVSGKSANAWCPPPTCVYSTVFIPIQAQIHVLLKIERSLDFISSGISSLPITPTSLLILVIAWTKIISVMLKDLYWFHWLLASTLTVWSILSALIGHCPWQQLTYSLRIHYIIPPLHLHTLLDAKHSFCQLLYDLGL